jgi:hypothetical protein
LRLSLTKRTLCLVAAAFVLPAQVPTVHQINLYGLNKVSAETVLQTAKLRSGAPLPPSKGDVEEMIEKVPGVLHARLEAICCEDQNSVLFVGIEERDGPHIEFHPEPSGNAALPAGIMGAYRQFLAALQRTAQRTSQTERDPGLSESEEKFASFATSNLAELRDTLRNGPEAEERAAAAVVIGYAPKKNDVAPDLHYALRDPDESVRSNAIRSLHASLQSADSAETIPVPLATLIDLLHSLVLSDRLEAADMLVTITNDGNREALALLRARALPALVEMARWESLRYAIRPYILVGRIAGFSEPEIRKWWSDGEREHVIQRALALPRATPVSNAAPSSSPAPPKQPAKQ